MDVVGGWSLFPSRRIHRSQIRYHRFRPEHQPRRGADGEGASGLNGVVPSPSLKDRARDSEWTTLKDFRVVC